MVYNLVIEKKGVTRLISSRHDNIPPTTKNAHGSEPAPTVTVSLFGSIRAAAGRGSEAVEIASGCVFYELLRSLSRAYGNEFKYEIFQEGGDDLRDDLIVSINGVITEHSKLEDFQLFDGAAVSLLPNFSGGG